MSGKVDEKHFLICPYFAAALLHCFNLGQGSGDGSTSNAQIISPLPLILSGWSVHNSFWTPVHLCCVWYTWLKPLSLERLREKARVLHLWLIDSSLPAPLSTIGFVYYRPRGHVTATPGFSGKIRKNKTKQNKDKTKWLHELIDLSLASFAE